MEIVAQQNIFLLILWAAVVEETKTTLLFWMSAHIKIAKRTGLTPSDGDT
jgi:hypothetical protein